MTALSLGVLLAASIVGSLRHSSSRIPTALVMLVAGTLVALLPHPAVATHIATTAESLGVYVVLFGIGEELQGSGSHPIAGRGLAIAGIGGSLLGLGAFGAVLVSGVGAVRALAIALAAIPTSGALAATVLPLAHVPRGSRTSILQAAIGDDLVSLALLAAAPFVLPTGARPTSVVATVVAVVIALVLRQTGARAPRLLGALVVTATCAFGTSPALAGALAGALLHDLVPRAAVVTWSRRTLGLMFFATAGFVLGSLGPLWRMNVAVVVGLLVALAISRLGLYLLIARPDRWIAVGMLPRGEVTIAIATALRSVIGAAGGEALLAVVLLSTVAAVLAGHRLSRRPETGA